MTNQPHGNQVNRMNVLNENGLRIVFLFVCFLTASWTTLDQTATAERRRLPLVINTWSFTEATKAAWQELNKPEGNVLDAVEVGCSTCEELQCDGSVGYGSHPDEKGRVTLDALIMDGQTQNVGAVAAMHSVKNAISVARKVLDHTQHSLLVGDAATQFAMSLGYQTESLETENSNKQHSDWLNSRCQPNFWTNVHPDPSSNCGPYTPNADLNVHSTSNQLDEAELTADIHSHDTIGMIAIDANGRIAVGTSTNGANHKIPGRVGDTAIPGSGGYADNEFGAAACTGDGDVIMRYSPASLAVHHLEQGKTPSEAAELALRRARERNPKNQAAIIVVNKSGDYGAACFNMERFPFSFMNSELTQVHYVDCFDRKVLI